MPTATRARAVSIGSFWLNYRGAVQSGPSQKIVPAIAPGDRIGALDGLRVFAVGSVLVSHAGFNHGGWVGVDTFFVLSGFLITCLLLGNKLDRNGLTDFWSRRFRRLLPGFILMVMVVTALLMTDVLHPRSGLDRTYSQGLWSLLYVGNWYEVISGADYWNGFATSPFGHLWSLGIEEQFYMLFPLFLAATASLGHRRRTLATLTIGVGSAVWAVTLFLLTNQHDRIYFGTDTRMFALLIGAAAAMVLARPPVLRRLQTSSKLVSAVGFIGLLVLIALSLFSNGSDPWLYLGGMALASMVSLVTVIGTVVGDGILQRTLDRQWLRWIGERSYGIYLWHLPVFVFLPVNIGELPPFSFLPEPFAKPAATLLLGGAITVALAAASYTFVENPLRHGGPNIIGSLRKRTINLPRSSASLASIGAAFVVLAGGLTFAVSTDAGGSGRAVTVDLADFVPASTGESGDPTATTLKRIQSLMIVGDSIAILIGAFSDVQGLNISARGYPGCGFLSANERFIEGEWVPWSDGCNNGQTKFLTDVADFDATMLIWGRWDLSDVKWQGETLLLGTPEYKRYLFSELDKYNAAVVKNNKPLYITSGLCFAGDFDYLNMPRPQQLNALLGEYADSHPNVSYLPLIDFVCRDGQPVNVNGQDLRPDTVHFSPEATSLVWKWLLPYVLGTKNAKARTSATTTTATTIEPTVSTGQAAVQETPASPTTVRG